VPPRQWKSRIEDMCEAAEKILDYCDETPSEEHFLGDHKTSDACIRNFQILGEAAGKIPASIQNEFKNIPWKEIKDMRNILVHQYFGVSSSILWSTIKTEIPKLYEKLKEIERSLKTPVHSWKICPPGETYVRSAKIRAHLRNGTEVMAHLRSEHCRELNDSIKSFLTLHETQDIPEMFFKKLTGALSHNDLGFKLRGKEFDSLIAGWTQYWNEVLRPSVNLDPNIVKALIASESSFMPDTGKGKRNVAKGLMQLMPLTLKALQGFRGELKDHLFEFSDSDIFDPSLNIAAGIRWLFHKNKTASRRLKREATWEETVAEYKDYLRRRLKNPDSKQAGMESFQSFLSELRK